MQASRSDLEDLSARVARSQTTLLEALGCAGAKADQIMGLLWWYWATMRALWRAEQITLATAEISSDGSLIAGKECKRIGLRKLLPRMRTRRSRARKRGEVEELRLFSYAAPFSGVGTVAIKVGGKVEVGADPHEILTEERSYTPLRKRGRPSLAEDPARLVPLAVATLLHEWCPLDRSQKGAGYLAWSKISDLLRTFTPPDAPPGYTSPAYIQREVRAYRNDPSLREQVRSLDQGVIPKILRAFGDR